jgi:hypothetical protein
MVTLFDQLCWQPLAFSGIWKRIEEYEVLLALDAVNYLRDDVINGEVQKAAAFIAPGARH